jgi:hypothetical protein
MGQVLPLFSNGYHNDYHRFADAITARIGPYQSLNTELVLVGGRDRPQRACCQRLSGKFSRPGFIDGRPLRLPKGPFGRLICPLP